MIRIGTDIGGTFTDIVWVDDESGDVKADKAPTTPADVVQGVMAAYAKTGCRGRCGRAVHPWVDRGDERAGDTAAARLPD